MSEQEHTEAPQETQTNDANSLPIAVAELPVPRDRTGKAVRKPKKIVHLRRKKLMRKGYKEPEKHEFDFWTKEDDELLKKVYRNDINPLVSFSESLQMSLDLSLDAAPCWHGQISHPVSCQKRVSGSPLLSGRD